MRALALAWVAVSFIAAISLVIEVARLLKNAQDQQDVMDALSLAFVALLVALQGASVVAMLLLFDHQKGGIL